MKLTVFRMARWPLLMLGCLPCSSLGAERGAPSLATARTDPFQLSALMQQKVFQAQGGVQFVAQPGARTPAMKLKGLLNKTLALIEIEGAGVHLVRAGDTLSLNKTGENLVIKIEKVDTLSLNVKVGTLEEMIVVR
jgi:hypothetical protein